VPMAEATPDTDFDAEIRALLGRLATANTASEGARR
jgi:hypothetical protein